MLDPGCSSGQSFHWDLKLERFDYSKLMLGVVPYMEILVNFITATEGSLKARQDSKFCQGTLCIQSASIMNLRRNLIASFRPTNAAEKDKHPEKLAAFNDMG